MPNTTKTTWFCIYVQGWGVTWDKFYLAGVHSTAVQADAALEEMLVEWEAGGCDRADMVCEIRTEVIELDVNNY